MSSSQEKTRDLSLLDLMTGFAESPAHAQQQLDSEWAISLAQYGKALPREAREWLSFACGLSPMRQVILESEISAALTFGRERSTQWRLSVLNLGFERKFVHSDFVRQTLTIKVVAHSWREEHLHGGPADGADR